MRGKAERESKRVGHRLITRARERRGVIEQPHLLWQRKGLRRADQLRGQVAFETAAVITGREMIGFDPVRTALRCGERELNRVARQKRACMRLLIASAV